MKPTNADWIKTVADVCPGLVSPMPIPEVLAELQWGDYSAEVMMQHLLVHLAKLHMDRDDQLERLRDKLSKIREVLDQEAQR